MKFEQVAPDLFLWTDSCNVYVLRDGDAAVLIDLGDGSVLDALPQIGVKTVEWVLFTHHHREQCQGAPRLAGSATKFAAPDAEKALFEQPHSFRKLKVSLGDVFTVHGASYVRPPLQPIKIERGFKSMDTFTWHGHEFWCLATPGNSPGGISYFLKVDDRWLAFTGDVMLDGATLHNWFDSEWDYGFAKGIYALYNSAGLIERFQPGVLCPSHGSIIKEPAVQLRTYLAKIKALTPLFVRGYDIFTFSNTDQDTVSTPTVVPHLWHVTPHIYKFKGPDYGVNFTIIIADSGHGLVIDCGLMDQNFLDDTIHLMQERLGLKQIDAAIITHMHGDHMVDAPHLREKWGAKLWTLDRVAEKCEFPERLELAAPVQAYGKPGVERVKFDGVFKSGESFPWEGYTVQVDWMPGQTEFHCCIHLEIDGKRVAFTGDNIFGSTTNPTNNGHECVMARNSGILEEGYIYGGKYLQQLKPDLIMGAHCWVMDQPAGLVDRYVETAIKLRDAFQGLSREDDYRLMFDPYWVRADPYRQAAKPGSTAEIQLHLRNFRDREQKHLVKIQTPPGITATPTMIDATLAANTAKAFPVKFQLTSDLPEQAHIIAFDASLDGKNFGPWFDMMIEVSKSAQPAAAG